MNLRLDSVPTPCYVPEPLHESSPLAQLVGQYVREGAVHRLAREKARSRRYWVPVFGDLTKGGDLRLITTLRGVNKCFGNDRFKMDSWGTLRNALKN